MAPEKGSEGVTPRRPRRPPAPTRGASGAAGPPPAAPPAKSPAAPPSKPPARARTPRSAPPAEDAPQYNRYRAGRSVLPRPAGGRPRTTGEPLLEGGRGGGAPRGPRGGAPRGASSAWRRFIPRRLTRKGVVLGLIALIFGWLLLSLLLFLLSSQFERTSLPSNVAAVLDPAGFPLTSANNILVLGSDRRPKDSKEPGAETSGFGRSDTIMLIRTGGGHAARLSIPRDTVVEIPGHGLQKINAAHAYGGPAESVSAIEHWLDVPINHVVEVNFENFPQLIDAMGGVSYTGGCIVSKLDGGAAAGGFTLRLRAGTHHLDGEEALALSRTRENLCAPNETDIQREEHQQALFTDMKSQLLSPTSFLRLPWIAWHAPPAIISDMSGVELLGMFGALALTGTPPTHVLKPTGQITLPSGEEGLTVSAGARRADVAHFLAG
jgi:LCP family protein required for cell wall assembly